jgi:hypothetical protein
VVERTLADAGLVVRLVRPDNNGGPAWPGFRYTAIRPAAASGDLA